MRKPENKTPIREMRIFRDGCAYIVENPGDFCLKCGWNHNQTEQEAMRFDHQESVKKKRGRK